MICLTEICSKKNDLQSISWDKKAGGIFNTHALQHIMLIIPFNLSWKKKLKEEFGFKQSKDRSFKLLVGSSGKGTWEKVGEQLLGHVKSLKFCPLCKAHKKDNRKSRISATK